MYVREPRGSVHAIGGVEQELGDFWTTFTQALTGAAGAINPTPVVPIVPVAPSSGIDTTTLLLLGGLGIGAYLILRKKKPASSAAPAAK